MLRQTDDKLIIIQKNYKIDFDNLNTIKTNLDNLREKFSAGDDLEKVLKRELGVVDSDRNKLMSKINEMTDIYETSIIKLSKDKEGFLRENANRRKQLISTSIFQILMKAMFNRIGFSLHKIKQTSNRKKIINKVSLELIQIKERYKIKLINTKFNKWKYIAVNCIQESNINTKLIEKTLMKKLIYKYLATWRNRYYKQSKVIDNNLTATKTLFNIILYTTQRKLRSSFHTWLTHVSFLSNRDSLLKKCITRKAMKIKSRVLNEISRYVKKCISIDKFKELSDVATKTKFKRSMFFTFREKIFIQENEKILNAQLVLEAANNQRKRHFFAKAMITMLLARTKYMEKSLIEKTHNAFKYNKLTERQERCKENLSHYTIECQKLNEENITTNKLQKETKQMNLMRAVLLIFSRRLRYYWEKWNNSVVIRNVSVKILERIFLQRQNRKLVNGFNNWYHSIFKEKEEEKKILKERKAIQLQELLDTNIQLDCDIEQQADHEKRIILLKLQRIINIVRRKRLKQGFIKWKQTIDYITNYQSAIQLLDKLLSKHKIVRTMNNLRIKTKEATLNLVRTYKAKIIENTVFRNLTTKGLYGLAIHNYQHKYAKELIRRTFTHLLHRKCSKLFNKWRTYGPKLTTEILRQENEQKSNEIVMCIKNIEENNKKRDDFIGDLERLAKIDKKRAQLTFSKLASVKEHNQLKTAISSWRHKAVNCKLMKTLLQRYIIKLHNSYLRSALYKWKDWMFFTNIGNIKNKLNKEQIEHKEHMQRLIMKLKETINETNVMNKNTDKTNKCTEIKRQQARNGLKILHRLMNSYKKKSLHGYYFIAWVKMYRRQKYLQRMIMSFTKRFVGKFTYSRLKWISSICSNRKLTSKRLHYLIITLKKMNMKNSFIRWRQEAKLKTKIQIYSLYEMCDEELIRQNEICNRIQDHSYEKHTSELLSIKMRKLLRGLKKQAKIQKLTRERINKFKLKIHHTQLVKSLLRWYNDSILLHSLEAKHYKAVDFNQRTLQRKLLCDWRNRCQKRFKLPKLLEKISKRYYLNLLGDTLERIDGYISNEIQIKNNKAIQGANKIMYSLEKLRTKQLGEILTFIKIRSESRMLDRENLKRILLKCFSHKLKVPFDQWFKKVEEQKLVEDIEETGKTAQNVIEMLRSHKSLVGIIHNSGLKGRLEKHLGDELLSIKSTDSAVKIIKPSIIKTSSKENKDISSLEKVFDKIHAKQQHNAACKFIKRWLSSTKQISLTSRFIGYWRNWQARRQLIVTSSKFIMKRLQYSEKSLTLHRLRRIKQTALKSYSQIPRDILISKITNDSKTIVELTKEKNDAERLINEYISLNRRNQWAYDKGKKLAISTLIKRFESVLYNAFTRWRFMSQKLVISNLTIIMGEKVKGLMNITEANKRLKEINRTLMTECGELRKSSMDGLEIASVVQEIAREREQMSVDLADRSLTIKKLIEENRNLQQQLDKLQHKNIL